MRFLIFTLLFFLSISSFALVDMQNANFSETWIDLEIPNTGFNLKISRAYNSRTLHNGIFGFGWCSDFETKLEVLADGRLKRSECGAGLETFYESNSFKKEDLEKSIQTIFLTLKKDNPKMKKIEETALLRNLREDPSFRDREAVRLNIKKIALAGTVFYNKNNMSDKITLEKSFYTRSLADGSSERFNALGQLTHVYDKFHNYLKLDYQGKNISSLATSSGYRLTFKYTPNGKVKEILGPNNIRCSYTYDKLTDLASATNAKNEKYSYEYDSLHNMTKISYPDKTSKAFKYDQDKDWVKELVDRDGCVEKYNYVLSKDDPKKHYWSTVEKKCQGKVVNHSKYEFWFAQKSSGTGLFLSKLALDINGEKSEIKYHDIFEKPILIKKAKETISYDYYSNGLLRSKTEGNKTIGFKYNKQNQVSEVSSGKENTKFTYDNSGNLTYAVNSEGQTVRLNYDNKGRIIKIFDQAKRLINIEYDERFGKPKTVERPGIGKIFVSYKDDGTINKIDSKNKDPAVAIQVANAFTNLLEIVTPAGVSIGL